MDDSPRRNPRARAPPASSRRLAPAPAHRAASIDGTAMRQSVVPLRAWTRPLGALARPDVRALLAYMFGHEPDAHEKRKEPTSQTHAEEGLEAGGDREHPQHRVGGALAA